MKKYLVIALIAVTLFSCQKQASTKLAPTTPEDESVVLKPKEGYSSSKRSNDFVEAQLRGKPVKNNVGNITDLSTKVISPYQIDLYFTGVRNAVSYNIYRDDVWIANSPQPHWRDFGLYPNTKYKYQVAAVASSGVVGNLSNIAFGTTFATDVSSKVIVFLQFDKDTTTSSYWIGYSGGLPLITEASGFNEEEKQIVTDGVAADYAQFPNVKVTRNRAEYDAASPTRRHKSIYTISYEWYGGPTPIAGGVSYLNVLGLDIPSFVFSSALYYNTHYNLVAGTHEVGHAIGGLHHAVENCEQSYGSDGNHMGAAYNAAVRFFNYHLTSNCNYEDQIPILTSRTQ